MAIISRGEYTVTPVFDGLSDKFYRAWADSADGSQGFSTTDSSKEYFGVYAGTTPPANYKAYSWTKIKGESGRSVTNTEMEYAINDSKSTPPTTGWSLDIPVWKTGLYIWQRVKVSYSTGNPSYTTPHCIESNIIEDVTNNIGNWVFKDKTEVLSGTEIFTDKADEEALVHVEVDGKSYQHAGSGKNLFKLTEIKTGYYTAEGVPNQHETSSYSEYFISVEYGKTYTWGTQNKYNIIINTYDANKSHIERFTSYSILTRSFDVNVAYVRVSSYNSNKYDFKDFQFEEGSTATPYELPAPSPDYPIEIHSLNDFDVVSSVGRDNLILGSGSILLNNSDQANKGLAIDNGDYVSIIPIANGNVYTTVNGNPSTELIKGEEYTLSFEVSTNNNVGVYWYAVTGGSVNSGGTIQNTQGEWIRHEFSYTQQRDTFKSAFLWGFSGLISGSEIRYRNLKLEKGNAATPYSLAHEDITENDNHPLIDKINLLLDEPLRSVGEVKDRLFRDVDGLWKVERNVGEHIEDGSTNWTKGLNGRFDSSSSPLSTSIAANYNYLVSSTHYMYYGSTTAKVNGTWSVGNQLRIVPPNESVTGEDVKLFMKNEYDNGNPVIWLYPRVTTIETLPQSLQDKLNNLRSFKDSNYVYTVLPDTNNTLSENLKPTLHATFKSIAWANDFRYKFEQSKAMHATDIWFAKGVSNTIAPNIGWSTDAPVWEDGLYIWSKTITTYGDGRTEETSPVCITGATGRSVDKIEEWYYLSNKPDVLEGGTWSNTPPTWTSGKYIWTKNKIIYKNPSGTDETAPINNTGGVGQKGDTGTDAKTARLANIIHAVHFDQDGLMPSVASIAFPTAIQGFTGLTPYYEFKMGDTIVRGSSTASSWTLNTSAMKYSDFPITVTVNVSVGGQILATDTVTIVGTKPGEDAYTVVLANESHTFVGDVSNAIAGSTTANVIAYRGGTQVGATIGAISGLPTGMSSAIYSSGTTSARVTFTVTTSMTSPNGVVNIPVTVNGKTFTKVFNYAIAFKGAKGDKGTDGLAGKDGVGIRTTALAYASSTSGTTTPASGWTTTVPTVAPGDYLWTRTTWTYSDNSNESGYTVSRIGKDGNTGADGIAGKDGVGIKSTVIHYGKSTSGTSHSSIAWTTAVPSVPNGQFLWTRTTWTYDDNTTETGYSVSKMGETGAKGDKGASGENATARNYLLDSKPSPIIGSTDYNMTSFSLAEKPRTGETYSFVLKGNLASVKTHFGIFNSGGYVGLSNLTYQGNDIYSATFNWKNVSSGYTADDTYISIYQVPSAQIGTSTIEWVTMVKGSVPLTEWVPAHEDIFTYVDDVEIGGTNLIIRHNETKNSWLSGSETYPNPTENVTYRASTMKEVIKVNPGEQYTFSKTRTQETEVYFRFTLLDEQNVFVTRYARDENNFVYTIPNGVYGMWVSYPTEEKVKIEKGNRVTGWSPSPEDVTASIKAAQDKANAASQEAIAAQSDATIGKNMADNLSNDSIITQVEKLELKREWDAIVKEKPSITIQATDYALQGSAEATAYNTAYTALNNLIPSLLANMNVASGVVRTTFNNNFSNYYDKRQLLLNRIAKKAKELADAAQSSVDNLEIGVRNLLRNSNFTNDFTYWLGSGARELLSDAVFGSVAKLTTTSTTGITQIPTKALIVGKEYTLSTYVKAENTSQTAYLAIDGNGTAAAKAHTVSNQWTKISSVFTFSGINLAARIYTLGVLYVANVKLEEGNKATDWSPAPEDTEDAYIAVKGIADGAASSASAANSLLADIASDSKLTPTEKKAAKKEWDIIIGEKSKIDSSADTYGITTQKTAYNTAYTALNNYLSSLLSNLNTTSNIVGTTFRDNFRGYYNARQDLLNEISNSAKSLVDDIEIGGRNLIIQQTITRGRYINALNTLVGDSAWFVTDYIPVLGYNKMTTSGYTNLGISPSVTYYDSSKKFVRGISNNGESRAKDITINSGEAFIRFSGMIADLPTIKLEKGNKATDWSPAPEDVYQYVDDIEIGGNNLADGTSDKLTTLDTGIWAMGITPSKTLEELGLKRGDVVTARIYIKATGTNNGGSARFWFWRDDGYGSASGNPIINGEGYSTLTYTIPSNANAITVGIQNAVDNGVTASVVEYKELMFEKGNKASAWRKSQNDLIKYVDDVEVGGTNLIVRHNETKNSWLAGNETYPIPTINSTYISATIKEVIKVNPGEQYVFSKTRTQEIDVYFRISLLNAQNAFVTRYAKPENNFVLTIPSGVYGMWVSYPGPEKVKIEKGNKTTGWSPAPEDVQSSIDEKADQSGTSDILQSIQDTLDIALQEKTAASLQNELSEFIKNYNKKQEDEAREKIASEKRIQDIESREVLTDTHYGDMVNVKTFIDRTFIEGEEGLMIKNGKEGTHILINDTSIDFFSNGTKTAYISQNKLSISDGTFIENLQIGNISASNETSKSHLTFRYTPPS